MVSSHTAYPPTTGGHMRSYQLGAALARLGWTVTHLSLTLRKSELSKPYTFRVEIGPRHVEYRVFSPVTQFLNPILQRLHAPPLGFSLLPPIFQNRRPFRRHLPRAAVVILENPWLVDLVSAEMDARTPLVYDAHNVEYDLYSEMLRGPLRDLVLARVFRMERETFSRSRMAFVCSHNDKDRAASLYGTGSDRVLIVPNGVDVQAVTPCTGSAEKNRLRSDLGLPEEPIVLFVGSAHPPNVEAVRSLLAIARERNCKDLFFLIVGSAGNPLSGDRTKNVLITGKVKDVTPYLRAADIAANPMSSGSGTNLKVLDFMASGLPVITTPTGARGLNLTDGVDSIVATLEAFPEALRRLAQDPSLSSSLAIRGRTLVEREYDWSAIGLSASRALESLIGGTGLPAVS